MKALVLDTATKSAALRDWPKPSPAGNEILVKVRSVALNPVDSTYVAKPIAEQAQRVVGSDFAGDVVGVSEELSDAARKDVRTRIGARVAGLLQGACSANDRPGAFAEYLVVDYDLVFLIAPHMSYNEAAAIPLCSLTAAQGTFFRNGLASPFWQTASSPSNSEHSDGDRSSPTNVFIYGSATSLGMYAAQMVQLAKKVAKQPIRLIGAASGKHMAYLKAAPYLYDAVVDYHDKDWPAQVRQSLDGGAKGVDYAVDAISELPMVLQINELLGPNGKQAIFRSPKAVGYLAEWEAMDRKPQYGGVWEGLKHEIRYSNGIVLPLRQEAVDFAVKYFAYLTAAAEKGEAVIQPNPVRLMPGGLEDIAKDGLVLQSSGLLSQPRERTRTEEHMRPISGEKLVYSIA